jgi:DNA repair protein RadC
MNFEHTHIREVRVNYPKTDIERFSISNPADVAEFVRKILPENSREHFIALYLDIKNMVAGYSILGIGAAEECIVPYRELFQRALVVGAVSIALAHNHPSGSADPSREDWATTRKIIEGASLLGLHVLDHVIVTDDGHQSMQELRAWNS